MVVPELERRKAHMDHHLPNTPFPGGCSGLPQRQGKSAADNRAVVLSPGCSE